MVKAVQIVKWRYLGSKCPYLEPLTTQNDPFSIPTAPQNHEFGSNNMSNIVQWCPMGGLPRSLKLALDSILELQQSSVGSHSKAMWQSLERLILGFVVNVMVCQATIFICLSWIIFVIRFMRLPSTFVGFCQLTSGCAYMIWTSHALVCYIGRLTCST